MTRHTKNSEDATPPCISKKLGSTALFLLLATAGMRQSHAQPGSTSTAPPMQARLELVGLTPQITLDAPYLTYGDGYTERMPWLGEDYIERTCVAHIEVSWFHWSRFSLRVTPQASGRMELRLSGPWVRDPLGITQRIEVLWDNLTAQGAVLVNGSFEHLERGQPQGWYYPRGTSSGILRNRPEPVDGRHMACTWHEQPLITGFEVHAGRPVTINGWARMRQPPHKIDYPHFTPGTSAAVQQLQQFRRGVNIGNYLESPPGDNWGATYDTSDFAAIRREGFDHVRIPAAWHYYTGAAPDFSINSEFTARVDYLITNALAHGLAVIINLHHFEEFMNAPEEQLEQFTAIWRQLGKHYAAFPDRLAFELLNEPTGQAQGAILNRAFAAALAAVRETNPQRLVLIGPANYNDPYELRHLIVPADSNLAVTVHNYRPHLFTHQGAAWTAPQTDTIGLTYPGPPRNPLQPAPTTAAFEYIPPWFNAYNRENTAANPVSRRAFMPAMELARAWSDYTGIPVRLGEFGCIRTIASDSRMRYYSDVRIQAEKLGMGWTIWDWRAWFRYWNPATQQPEPGMRQALFPEHQN